MTAKTQQNDCRLDEPTGWVDQYADMMLSFALARTGRRDVAEDLVQETFLAAWKARDTFDGRSQRSTWLVSILRRKIADHFRAQAGAANEVPTEQLTTEGGLFDARGKWVQPPRRWKQTPDEAAEDAEFWHVLAGCLSDLPPHLAEAFELREVSLETTNDICRMAGITQKNLSVRLHRARLLLRRCLEHNWFCKEGFVR